MKNKSELAAPGVFDEDFLLTTASSCDLYHGVAANLPIIDYHGHLSPHDLATNRTFANLTEIWLKGDHYKWRAMRANGISESFITGDAASELKFAKWAETVPFTVMNPLFHWTHLELKRPFGIKKFLNEKTATVIWKQTERQLAKPSFSVYGLLKNWDVRVIGTTDDPTDDLVYHDQLACDLTCPAQVLPTFRPDRGLAIEQPLVFQPYLKALGKAANVTIRSFSDFVHAHEKRLDVFHKAGCRLSDHALEVPPDLDFTNAQLAYIFRRAKTGTALSSEDAERFRAGMLYHLGCGYAARGWTQQFHIGALRNVNSRLAQQLGVDAGCDTIGDQPVARGLARMLNRLDREDRLPKTILYNLNPADNEVFAAMTGSFQDGSLVGKIQYGSGWWFLDQKDGMERQMKALANLGLISCFIGMTTDSRSFLSFSRHEYFRRIVCDLFGRAMHTGAIPNDLPHIRAIMKGICYHNADRFFGFPTRQA